MKPTMSKQQCLDLDSAYEEYSQDANKADGLGKALLTLATSQVFYIHTKEDKEDYIQEAVMRVWEGIPRYNPTKSKFSTWAWTVMYRGMLNVAREASEEQKKAPTTDIESLNPKDYSELIEFPRDGVEEDRRAGVVRNALNRIHKDKREVVRLRLDGDSFEDIASKLHLKISTVKMRWKSALEGLAKRTH